VVAVKTLSELSLKRVCRGSGRGRRGEGRWLLCLGWRGWWVLLRLGVLLW
jgi:hypothetical protein